MTILGIDIGGSGIKGALVDTGTGTLVTDRHRIPTPSPSTPAAVTKVIAKLVKHFEYEGPLGCTFPARIKHGAPQIAMNVDKTWIGVNAEARFEEATGCPTVVLNDADAAGVAEMRFGAGRGRTDLVLLLTFGTGIGSALFVNQVLVPNTELGHLEFGGKHSETYASDRARKRDDLSWEAWAGRVQEYLEHIEFLVDPDLIIIGGGVSKAKRKKKYFHHLQLEAELVTAELKNEAGIVGAACYAETKLQPVG